MNDSIQDVLRRTAMFGRTLFSGRLHRDEIDSDAGLAVTIALSYQDRGRLIGTTLYTFACQVVRRLLAATLRKQARYQHASQRFWSSLAAPCGCHTERLTATELAQAGASVRQIADVCGVTFRQAHRVHAKAKHGN